MTDSDSERIARLSFLVRSLARKVFDLAEAQRDTHLLLMLLCGSQFNQRETAERASAASSGQTSASEQCQP